MVKRPPVMTGLGMKRAGLSSFRMALRRFSRCSRVTTGKMSTPCRAGRVGDVDGRGMGEVGLCRLKDGEGRRVVVEGGRRRLEGEVAVTVEEIVDGSESGVIVGSVGEGIGGLGSCGVGGLGSCGDVAVVGVVCDGEWARVRASRRVCRSRSRC